MRVRYLEVGGVNKKIVLGVGVLLLFSAALWGWEGPPVADPSPGSWYSAWDCSYQCHGDADCMAQGKMGYRVYIADLDILMNVWLTQVYDASADFDRDWDVDGDDEAMLNKWYGIAGVPNDCPAGFDNDGNLHVPSEYPYIQIAINLARDGETVIIEEGEYEGLGFYDIDFKGRNVTMQSTDPCDPNMVQATVIDCNGLGRGFYFHSGEQANSVLAGLTIKNGYVSGHGGAILCEQSSPTISRCRIINNQAGGHGGGMYIDDSDNIVITGCEFLDNIADDGGGIFALYSDAIVSHCIFQSNQSVDAGDYMYGGGGIRWFHSTPIIKNCIFSGNSAAEYGGGIRIDACGETSLADIANCTFYGNTASSGGAVAACGGWGCRPEIRNSIVWGNEPNDEPGTIVFAYGKCGWPSMTVDYSVLQNHWQSEDNLEVTNCFIADPCFADANNLGYHLLSEAGRWDPNSQSWVLDAVTSPCIDAGNPGSPLGDEPSDANNVRLNMGAYGGTVQASKTPANWSLLGDLDNNGEVNFTDLDFQLQDWLITEYERPGDLDRSDSVDIVDFALLAQDWLEQTTWH